jgi:hypothetical protein
MIYSVQSFVQRVSNIWSVALFGVAALMLLLTVNFADFAWTLPGFKHVTQGVSILDMQWHYDAVAAYRLLTAQGVTGRAQYLRMLWTVDVVIPLLVTLWLASTVVLALRRLSGSGRRRAWLVLLPLAAGASDYVENTLISILLAYYPVQLNVLAAVAGYATTVKHTLYALSVVTAMSLWLGVLVRSLAVQQPKH